MADLTGSNKKPNTSILAETRIENDLSTGKSLFRVPLDNSKLQHLSLDVLGHKQATINIKLVSHATLGRTSAGEGDKVDIDLVPYGALDAGVSRCHAVLFIYQNGLYIVDMNSTNGTKVNGVRLKPEQPCLLKDNVTLELGKLAIRLHVSVTPTVGLM